MFFFQAEDGIRDFHVTGVQACALPIYAMPVRMDQELEGWAHQLQKNEMRLRDCMKRLSLLAQGGTAVGTGINAHPQFAPLIAQRLSEWTGIQFQPNTSFFESLSSQDTAVELSGQLRTLAVTLMKIAND